MAERCIPLKTDLGLVVIDVTLSNLLVCLNGRNGRDGEGRDLSGGNGSTSRRGWQTAGAPRGIHDIHH